MYIGTIYISTEFRPDQDFKYGRQAVVLENQQSAITPGSSPNFYHRYN
jgi:hypothetical protein